MARVAERHRWALRLALLGHAGSLPARTAARYGSNQHRRRHSAAYSAAVLGATEQRALVTPLGDSGPPKHSALLDEVQEPQIVGRHDEQLTAFQHAIGQRVVRVDDGGRGDRVALGVKVGNWRPITCGP